jgi:hypothetical protein
MTATAETSTSTKLPTGLLRQAKVVATLKGVPLCDYLAGLLRPLVQRDYGQEVGKAAKEK